MNSRASHNTSSKRQYLTGEEKSSVLTHIDNGLRHRVICERYMIYRRQVCRIRRNRENIMAESTAVTHASGNHWGNDEVIDMAAWAASISEPCCHSREFLDGWREAPNRRIQGFERLNGKVLHRNAVKHSFKLNRQAGDVCAGVISVLFKYSAI